MSALNNLKVIKKDALQIRENHLRYYVDETVVESNLVHATYLRNLINIEK